MDLVPLPDDGTMATMRFLVDPALGLATHVDASRLREGVTTFSSQGLSVRLIG
jgi:hypothetical protein